MEWLRPHPAEFAAALGLGLLGLLMLARRAARSPGARSKVLMGLRASTLAIVVSILLDPVRTTETRLPGERPSVVYLVDGSRSMGLERPTTRLDQALRLQVRAEGSIADGRLPTIDRYQFGRRLAAIPPGEAVRPVDDESRLREALERLPERFGDVLPRGVFVFSDGRASESVGLEAIAQGYRKLGVPIHVLPVGDPAIVGDVAIRDLVVPRAAAVGSKIVVKLSIASRGFEGQRAEVAIRPASGPDVQPLARLPLTLVEGDQPVELVIEADRARTPLVVEVDPLPGEAVLENNRIPFQVASKSNKIRVIYMEGSADPEYAFLRDALVESPDMECVAMSLDSQNNFQPRLHRVGEPAKGYPSTREELLSFDVVICSDIARAAFTPEQLQWTVELVAERGGGFAMVGGHTSFGSGGWDRTPWDGMIPIDMSGDGPGRGSQYYDGAFRVVVPSGAEGHPIWRMVDDPARNREILDRMPPFYGTNLTDRLKPASTVLGSSDRPLAGLSGFAGNSTARKPGASTSLAQSGTPIFTVQPYGRGRSFAMSTDTTVAWGTDFERKWGEGDNRYFRKFWRNVVNWLAENSSGSNRRLELATDKILYRPGQPIRVTARAFDETLNPTGNYRLAARLLGPGPRSKGSDARSRVLDAPLTYRPEGKDFEGSLPVPAAEVIRREDGATLQPSKVEVVALDGENVVAQATLDVQILDDSEEFRDPRPDPGCLTSLAKISGGTVLAGPDDLARLLEVTDETVDRIVTSRAPTWDHPALLALLVALLAAEWALRRSRGMA